MKRDFSIQNFLLSEKILLLTPTDFRGDYPALLEQIRAVLSASPFHGEGHRKAWARLRVGGIRTSLRRVLRLMRENDLLAPGRVGRPRGPRNHDGTIIPDDVNTMWGTDMTTTMPSASASTRPGVAPVSRRWNRCVRGCGGTSAPSARTRSSRAG